MESKSVTQLIAQWRDSVGDAEDPADPAAAGPGWRTVPGRLLGGIGGWRLAGGVAALAVFALLVLAVARPSAEPPAAVAQQGEAEPVVPPGNAAPPTDVGPGPGARAATDWLAVMARVDDARGRAYATGSAEPLHAAFLAGGPALAMESARVAAIAERGLSVSGWQTEVVAVGIVSPAAESADTTVLRTRDRRGEYRVSGAGEGPRAVPAAAEAEWLVTLRWEGDRWLVEDVRPG